jgi:hypothetical protein
VSVTHKLTMRWSKREQDFVIDSPARPDGHLLHVVLNCERWNYEGRREPSLVAELDRRGYDTSTLRFSVQRKPCPCVAPMRDVDPACPVHGKRA